MKQLTKLLIVFGLIAVALGLMAMRGKNPCNGLWFELHPKLKEECLHNLKFIDKRGDTQENKPQIIFDENSCGERPEFVSCTTEAIEDPCLAYWCGELFSDPTSVCGNPPASWVMYKVQKHDAIYTVATRYGLTARQLMEANCLSSPVLLVGQVLLVPSTVPSPPQPTPTPQTEPYPEPEPYP